VSEQVAAEALERRPATVERPRRTRIREQMARRACKEQGHVPHTDGTCLICFEPVGEAP